MAIVGLFFGGEAFLLPEKIAVAAAEFGGAVAAACGVEAGEIRGELASRGVVQGMGGATFADDGAEGVCGVGGAEGQLVHLLVVPVR